MSAPGAGGASGLPVSHLLEVRGLEKSYGRRTVVRGVSFHVDRGEVVGLLGPNGAGKTTTFRMTMGLVKSDRGSVLFNGDDVARLPMYRRARLGMGYLAQEPSVFKLMTVEDNILAILEYHEPDRRRQAERLDELIEMFGLGKVRKSLATGLSGGERRRVEIARALVTRPSLILLDEPFAAIDPITVSDIRRLVISLKERGIGVLLTDHNVRETLSTTDRAYVIFDGEILVAGSPDEILAHPVARARYLGEDFEL